MQSIAETCVRFDAAHLSINLVSEIAVPMFTTLRVNRRQFDAQMKPPAQQQQRETPTSEIDSTTQSLLPAEEFPSEFSDVNTAEVPAPGDADMEARINAAVAEAEMRIKFVPLVFILLRIWDTVHILASLIVTSSGQVDENGCTSTVIAIMFVVIGVFEVYSVLWKRLFVYCMANPAYRSKGAGI